MKRIVTRGRSRVWYEADEIEEITAAALRKAALWPRPGGLAVDVEQLVEVALGATVDYGGELPERTLGFTQFGEPHRVVVSRRLTELALSPQGSAGLRGRWRATLAHEAAHILLHAHLDLRSRTSGVTETLLDGATESLTAGHDWREVQANMGMAALLMPRGPFLAEARRILERDVIFLPLLVDALVARRLVELLAAAFETSQEATRFRLLHFGWLC